MGRGRLSRYLRDRLHRRLFVWFGVSIVASVIVTTIVGGLLGAGAERNAPFSGAAPFVAGRFADVWDEPQRRHRLAASLSETLGFSVTIRDARGALLDHAGGGCRSHRSHQLTVRRDAVLLGTVQLCSRSHSFSPGVFLLLLVSIVVTLWFVAWLLTRRLTRSLSELERVAKELGDGKLKSRVRLARREPGEVGRLAVSIDEMASRIEQQVADQKELLAGVSHEIRTPLARLRVLVELARSPESDPRCLDQLEEEVMELDRLVGELIASSRLDFAQVDRAPLQATEVATRALLRASLASDLLRADSGAGVVNADPTLLARALANLLENARKHGGGVTRLEVSRLANSVCFAVCDEGPGFPESDKERVFEAFFGSSGGAARARETSLGLGLALVKRIAEAHDGRAWVENQPGGGARVCFSVSLEEPR